jgi:hypothetical protein
MPTNPTPAQTTFTTYSSDDYPGSWDPYGGHGWYVAKSSWQVGWYNDGTKAGVLIGVDMPHGYLKTTVAAASMSGTATFTAIAMGGGTNLNPGDYFWIQTCTPGMDPASCATANGGHLTTARADTVNTMTKVVTYTVLENNNCVVAMDCMSEVPVVGGAIYAGATYEHGEPAPSRKHFRLQIYPESEFLDVKNGAAVYSPLASEDVGMVAQFSLNGLGDPTLGVGGVSACCGDGNTPTTIAAILPDPTNHKIIVVYKYFAGGGQIRHAYFVFSVS